MAARPRPSEPSRNTTRVSRWLPSGLTTATVTAVSPPRGRASTARPISESPSSRTRSARCSSDAGWPSCGAGRSVSVSPKARVSASPSPRRPRSAPRNPISTAEIRHPRASSRLRTAAGHVVSPRAQTWSPTSSRTRTSVASTRASASAWLDSAWVQIRMSTASVRAYVATIGRRPASSRSPSRSATADSPMPVSRSVRETSGRPSPRATSRGTTQSCHIGRISRGGPGKATTRL